MPVTDPSFSQFGGDTSCVAVECGTKRLILDAGTGLVKLGEALKGQQDIDILLSHTHIDHILGLLFFTPLYQAGQHIRIFAGHLLPDTTLKATLGRLMSPPIFPIHIHDVDSHLELIDFQAGEKLTPRYSLGEGVEVTTHLLNHPDRATGYRITYGGKSLCYITDIEHAPEKLDASLQRFIHGADYLIYDSTFDDAEFEQYRGWGHSTWQQAIRLAEASQVKRLGLYHHHHLINDIKLSERKKLLNSRALIVDVLHQGLKINI